MPADTPFKPVEGPRFSPLKYGLLSAAEIVEDPDSHWKAGTKFWLEECGVGESVTSFCVAGGPATGTGEKSPTGDAGSSAAEPFTLYAYANCAPVGYGDDLEDLKARARTQLDRSENRMVERMFWTGTPDVGVQIHPHLAADAQVFANAEGASTLELQSAATTLTAVTDVVDAFSVLEGSLGECYGGEGVLHVPAGAVAYLKKESQIEAAGPILRSPSGHKVAVYSSNNRQLPTGSNPAAGAYTFYATGAVMARRSPVFETGKRPGEFVGKRDNSTVFIVERTYVIDWDCCHYAVQVTP